METENKGLKLDKAFAIKAKKVESNFDLNCTYFEDVRKEYELLTDKELQTKLLIELKIISRINSRIYKNVKFFFYMFVLSALIVIASVVFPTLMT